MHLKNTNEQKAYDQELDNATKKIDEDNKKILEIKKEVNEKNKNELLDLNENIPNNTNQENINNITKETNSSLKEVKEKENVVKETSYKKNSYVLQLASVSDIKLVPKEWKRLLRIYPKLGEKKYEIKKKLILKMETYITEFF